MPDKITLNEAIAEYGALMIRKTFHEAQLTRVQQELKDLRARCPHVHKNIEHSGTYEKVFCVTCKEYLDRR